ncbi:transporter substrate-binding domain-containing protein [Chengkuizengella axinellae]|uniref:Transporter substrate-binding domain-containing protein n=1 Tax=Chengkuizengella axinellae TaxID=3064388 RepID=A0ABT9J077_9BACL|nr:transporter substrate-binding domain-containing protein [Chengkuizengella sp. 2205SS18-9]MDP5275031.1 transporter substrate-binding domain-containing protein [Chengkuizengella sp. 2205SS18-9]
MKRIFLLTIALLFVLAGCSAELAEQNSNKESSETETTSQNQNENKNKENIDEVLIVGIEKANQPFAYLNEDSELVGIDVDFMKAIADNQGLSIEFKPLLFRDLIPSLQAGEIDIAISGTSLTVTDETKEQVDFTAEDVYLTTMNIRAMVQEEGSIKNIEELKEGDVIVAKQGSIAADVALLLSERFGAQVRLYDTEEEVILDIKNGNAHVSLVNGFAAQAILFDNTDYELRLLPDSTSEYTDEILGIGGMTIPTQSIAVEKGNTQLLDQLNEGLRQGNEKGKGDIFYQISNKYVVAIQNMTPEEWELLKKIDPSNTDEQIKDVFYNGENLYDRIHSNK